jgi:hypothetical protein
MHWRWLLLRLDKRLKLGTALELPLHGLLRARARKKLAYLFFRAMVVKVFVATGDDAESLVAGKLNPSVSSAWAEWPGSKQRVPCFLHLTLIDDINVWQTHTLAAHTPLDQVVDIPLPSICLYPLIFQPDDQTMTAARIVRALAKMTGGPSHINTETSVMFRADEDDEEEQEETDGESGASDTDVVSLPSEESDDFDDDDEYDDDTEDDDDDEYDDDN